jgi:hypothetical protein
VRSTHHFIGALRCPFFYAKKVLTNPALSYIILVLKLRGVSMDIKESYIDIFMDWAFVYNEKKEAMVLAVDKYQFREALVALLEEMEER